METHDQRSEAQYTFIEPHATHLIDGIDIFNKIKSVFLSFLRF